MSLQRRVVIYILKGAVESDALKQRDELLIFGSKEAKQQLEVEDSKLYATFRNWVVIRGFPMQYLLTLGTGLL